MQMQMQMRLDIDYTISFLLMIRVSLHPLVVASSFPLLLLSFLLFQLQGLWPWRFQSATIALRQKRTRFQPGAVTSRQHILLRRVGTCPVWPTAIIPSKLRFNLFRFWSADSILYMQWLNLKCNKIAKG